MNKSEASDAIHASLERGSSTPATWTADRDEYIKEKSLELEACVIDPVRVRITGETFRYGAHTRLNDVEVFAIARRGEDWLLFAPVLRTFSLAFGSNEQDLSILGFASTDALAEWLGRKSWNRCSSQTLARVDDWTQ